MLDRWNRFVTDHPHLAVLVYALGTLLLIAAGLAILEWGKP
jgi:hypothetical protein